MALTQPMDLLLQGKFIEAVASVYETPFKSLTFGAIGGEVLFYLLLMIFTTSAVYLRSKSIPMSVTMLVLTGTLMANAGTGGLLGPSFNTFLFIIVGLAVIGVFLGVIFKR